MLGFSVKKMIYGSLQSLILSCTFVSFILFVETKDGHADPCRNAGNGYINGYSNPDSPGIENKVVSFTMGLPVYRVINAKKSSAGYSMTNIEWKDNGARRSAWVSTTALFCENMSSPGLPPFKLGDTLENSLDNKFCDLNPSSEWIVNQATGLDSREFISRSCALKLVFVRARDGSVRLQHGILTSASGDVVLSTNEGIRIGSTEEQAVSEFVTRMVPAVSDPGRVLSVDDIYVGYIIRFENGIVNAIEFGRVRE